MKDTSMSDGNPVARAVSAIDRNIKELVKTLGDPDEAVSDEAFSALMRIGPLAADPLAAAIARPRTTAHRAKAIAVVGCLDLQESQVVERALRRAVKNEPDKKVAHLASFVLSDLLMAAGSRQEGSRNSHRSSEARMLMFLQLAQ
jgi:hypothetical protein